MTIFDLLLLINRLSWLFIAAFIFGCGFLILLLFTRAWTIWRGVIFDCIAFYGSFQAARQANLERQARLKLAQQYGQLLIAQQRKAIQGGAPLREMRELWQAGKFDVLIDEVERG